MEKKDEIRYNNYSEYLNSTRERTNYSIKRMDLLLISVCGGGLFLIFQIIKEIKLDTLKVDNLTLLTLSGVCFILCICINFMSQLTGYDANDNEEKYIIQKLKEIEGSEDHDKTKMNSFDEESLKFSRYTKNLNITSILFMFSGLFLLFMFVICFIF